MSRHRRDEADPRRSADPDRILYVVQLPPPHHGVAQVNSVVVSDDTLNDGLERRIVPLSFARDLADLNRFRVAKVLRLIWIWLRIWLALLRYRPDVVYMSLTPTGIGFVRDLLLMVPAKLLRRGRCLFHIHGQGVPEWIESRRAIRSGYRWLLDGESVIHLSSGLAARELAPIALDTLRIFVVENGIEPHPIASGTSASNSDSSFADEPCDVPKLLFLSNLLPSKGLEVLLRACGVLRRRRIDFRLQVVGEDVGFDQRYREVVREEGLGVLVRFVGPLHGEKKWVTLATADILVHPSLDDTFPLVILEGMHAGCAVVASDVGAIPEILEGVGLVVPRGAIDPLADALEQVCEDPELRARLARDARTRARDRFSRDAFLGRMRRTFDEVLERRPEEA